MLLQDEIEKYVLEESREPTKKSKKVVNVSIFDITWLAKNARVFADFVPFLTASQRNSLFESKTVNLLLSEFWKTYQLIIIK